LNRCCVFTPDLESMFPAEMLKRLLQHNPPKSGHFVPRAACPLSAISGHSDVTERGNVKLADPYPRLL
jgi:hypothetical protein